MADLVLDTDNSTHGKNDTLPNSTSGVPVAASDKMAKGTLKYTKYSLVVVFFYLLWGDFCLQMLEMVIPAILPFQLKDLNASNMTTSILLTTVPFFFNMVMNPAISFRSDNYRSQWGRRIPYLFKITPFVALLLILFAFSPEIGNFLHGTFLLSWIQASPATVIIGTMAVILVLFQMMNYCMIPIYYYLFVDVVPDAYMGRFMAVFRIVGTLSGFFFNTYIYGHALTHTRAIYIGIALTYCAAFMLMCWRIKEGEYPPPVHGSRLGFWASIRVYAKECYSHRHYLYFNARNTCWVMAGLCNFGLVIFFRDGLNIPIVEFAKINGWTSLVSCALLFPMGMLSDKFKPIRIVLIATVFLIPMTLANFFFLQDKFSYLVLAIIGLPLGTLMGASELPFYASIPPRERYGQFGSANQIVISFCSIIGGVIAGRFIDWVTQYGKIAENYRYLYLWVFGFQCLSLIFLILLYRSWRKCGGPYNYVPPPV